MGPPNPFKDALRAHDIEASVVDLDHYRLRGGLSVETDYIILVKRKSSAKHSPLFDSFKISKTFSAFRSFASQLKKTSLLQLNSKKKDLEDLSPETKAVLRCVESVSHMVESQRTQYIGKVNYSYVKGLAQQRSQIVTDVLETTLAHFPYNDGKEDSFIKEVSSVITTFFLTDHVEAIPGMYVTNAKNIVDVESKKGARQASSDDGIPFFNKFFTPQKKRHQSVDIPTAFSSPVIPLTKKSRRSLLDREHDQSELETLGVNAQLQMDDDRGREDPFAPDYSRPVSTTSKIANSNWLAYTIENSPVLFLVICAVSTTFLKGASQMQVTVDMDVALLFVFAAFCVGLHTPRPSHTSFFGGSKIVATNAVQKAARPRLVRKPSALIRRSMILSRNTKEGSREQTRVEHEVLSEEAKIDDADPLIESPMPMWPEGAKYGSLLNRWSPPRADTFMIRGSTYLKDHKKIHSGGYIFPPRGVDLFLTDTSPSNVARVSGIMGGQLRQKATFVTNFILPWGVLLFYFEIPERFHPFIRKGFDKLFDDAKEPLPDLASMSPGDRAMCRFLMGDDSHRSKTLKIVPVVVDSPSWLVKQAVGGKPAIVGTKLPVNYVYAPTEQDSDGRTTKELYLEADLDIVASSAARGILSVVRSYTQSLTMDLGFVVQGNHEDELPEQMLGAVRMHGIDPFNAPPLPPMKQAFDDFHGDEKAHED